jgi:hypothetical protein
MEQTPTMPQQQLPFEIFDVGLKIPLKLHK